ncbi:UDP-N-acetylmuramoyl-tripeptide--D-alanyl-D-alanine ligase [Uliginosibacterium sp. sgz301328]|uniref:UDP-N-acetylmuramoyl-tripeptide--D-alanyl-D- alanine ligase n=1 Tax=Uliginosibacterium sp. sgz301328 TaxID=3243764 RepID=UPI00359D7117
MMKLSEAAVATRGRIIGNDIEFDGIGTDTRRAMSSALFVALRGERFDGHDYIDQANSHGAVAAMVARGAARNAAADLPLLEVEDTRLALGDLAAYWRTKFDIPLIGVTGSNGKTTVKEMIAAILRAAFGDDAVLATQGNLNNDIGMPQMLLRLEPSHRAAVLEMGMNHPGEIAYLAAIARPTVSVVTNAQRAHLEGMGELDAVAREKGSIYNALPETGVAIVNLDDSHAEMWREQNAGRRVVTFGLSHAADVCATASQLAFGSRIAMRALGHDARFELPVPGIHNVRNAMAAAAATLSAGVSLDAVVAGLSGFSGTKGRLQVRRAKNGAVLLDDTYNANPDSVRAGVDVLAATPGKKILVLGDMGEIGDMSAQLHDEVGGYAKSQGVDNLLALGENSEVAVNNFGSGGQHFERLEDLVKALEKLLAPDVVVLVKGSRFMKMERVSDAIAQEGT